MIFTWNASPIAFEIPYINFSVHWYGIFFALGFLFGYFYVTNVFKKSNQNTDKLDSLLMYMFVGTIVGARLGHCFFYEPSFYLSNPIEILKIWKGGLASHGGGIGLVITVLIFCKINNFKFLKLADLLCIPTAFVGGMIRLGNFFNSEIYGKPTNNDFGIIFERIDLLPRHPVQLYESISYFFITLILLFIYKKLAKKYSGLNLGFFLILIFSIRFILEFFKPEQASYTEQDQLLTIGQYLSIPFVITGLILIILSKINHKTN